MANFSPNLDDGELFLPSGIFPAGEQPPMAELARRFASFSITHRRRTQLAGIPPPVGSFPAGDLRLNGGSGFSYRVEEQWPVWLNRGHNPVGFRAEPVFLNRGSNRVWPLQRSGAGTGVFLPRVGAAVNAAGGGGRRRQSVRNKQEFPVVAQRNSVAVVDMGMKKNKQDECHCHLPPDLGLPQEWTY